MPTPPVNSAWTMSHLTAGTRQPWSTEAAAILRISVSGRPLFSGVKPTSCIIRNATANITTSTTPRSTNGTPRLVHVAISPPATDPASIATPLTICPRPNTASSDPV